MLSSWFARVIVCRCLVVPRFGVQLDIAYHTVAGCTRLVCIASMRGEAQSDDHAPVTTAALETCV